MKKQKHFRDFVLLEFNHPKRDNFFLFDEFGEITGLRALTVERMRSNIERCVKLILSETKTGDTVMIESPKPVGFEDFRKHYETTPYYKYWNDVMKEYLNFYASIAEKVAENGRNVVSLEPRIWDFKKGFVGAYLRIGKLAKEKSDRVNYLAIFRRTNLMIKRINKFRPKMVVTANYHAFIIKDKMKPKKSVWATTTLTEWATRIWKEKDKIKVQGFLRKKSQRRRAINKKKGNQKKGWRPKP